jgi:K+-transporting ATPase ATPase C chain
MRSRDALTALRLTLALLLIAGVGFPAVLLAVAQTAFPWQAESSLVRDRCGRVVGSALVGQRFDAAHSFQGRPSASGYDGISSGGSNLGASNPALAESLEARAIRFRRVNGLAPVTPLPVDAITASGSGLDPEISLEAAELQVGRVAGAYRREGASGIDSALVASFVRARAVSSWPRSTERRVNVLALNLGLDSLAQLTRCPSSPR